MSIDDLMAVLLFGSLVFFVYIFLNTIGAGFQTPYSATPPEPKTPSVPQFTIEELQSMKKADLQELAGAYELTVPKSWTKDKIVSLIVEELEK